MKSYLYAETVEKSKQLFSKKTLFGIKISAIFMRYVGNLNNYKTAHFFPFFAQFEGHVLCIQFFPDLRAYCCFIDVVHRLLALCMFWYRLPWRVPSFEKTFPVDECTLSQTESGLFFIRGNKHGWNWDRSKIWPRVSVSYW